VWNLYIVLPSSFYEEDRTHGSLSVGFFDIMESSVLLFVVQVVRERE